MKTLISQNNITIKNFLPTEKKPTKHNILCVSTSETHAVVIRSYPTHALITHKALHQMCRYRYHDSTHQNINLNKHINAKH